MVDTEVVGTDDGAATGVTSAGGCDATARAVGVQRMRFLQESVVGDGGSEVRVGGAGSEEREDLQGQKQPLQQYRPS